MVKTFDWVAKAQGSEMFKAKLTELLENNTSDDIEVDDMYRLQFCADDRMLTISPVSVSSPFSEKIVPMRISYHAALCMINDDWDSIENEEVEYLE